MAISRFLCSLLRPSRDTSFRAVGLGGLTALSLAFLMTSGAIAQEAPTQFTASPVNKLNGGANPGFVELTWVTPPGVSDDLKYYEFVRISLRPTGSPDDVAAWMVPFDPTNPPTSFCDQVNRNPTLATAPYRTYEFAAYRPPAPPAPDPAYPFPYIAGLGPNWGVTPDGDPDLTTPPVALGQLLPPSNGGVPTGPSESPWTATLQATAYRYYMRAVYDTNEQAPAPRFEGSAWVTDDGWRQVVVDVVTPLGPVQTPFNQVSMGDLYVTDVRRPFVQPVPANPAFKQYSDINIPFGDVNGCPIVGVRLQWKAGPTTSAPSADSCGAAPWPILGDPRNTATGAPLVTATLNGDNVTSGMNTPGLPGGSVILTVENGSDELSLLTRGAFLRNGDMLDVIDGSPLDVALGGAGNGTYYVSVLENDFFGVLGGVSKIALSVNQTDAVNFNRANFLTANANSGGPATLPFIGEATAVAATDIVTLPPGMYLNQGDEIEVIDSSLPALIRSFFVIRQNTPAAARTTLPANQIKLAISAANAQALTAFNITANATLTIRTQGAGLPVRYRVERGYVSANATAVDLPPDNVFTIYESPEIADLAWTGLGTFQALPTPTDWTVSRDVIFDDTFQLPNQNPPVCQFAYWYGVTQFITLDTEGLYEITTDSASVLVDPTTGTPILPIGAYACNNVDLDATGVVGPAADPAECSGATFCIPAGTSTVLGDRIRVTWDVAAQTFYSQFRVYRGVCPEDDPALYELQGPFVVVPGTTNAFSDFATAPNTKYWYRVEAFQPLSGWTQITPPEIGFRLPPPSVTSATDGTLVNRIDGTVSKPTDWDPASMRLWRRVTSVTPVVWQDLGPITGNTFSDTTAQAGFVYAYAATAHSDEVDADSIRGVVNQGYPAVGAPTSMAATTNSPQYVRVSWASPVASGAPVSYQVFRRKSGTSRYTQIGTTTSLAYFDVTAVPNTNYQYQVRVRLSNGALSAFSTAVTGRRIVVPGTP